jgi:hypothetical protein
MYPIYSDLLLKANGLPSLWTVKSRIERIYILNGRVFYC